jgi:hypothetical protein
MLGSAAATALLGLALFSATPAVTESPEPRGDPPTAGGPVATATVAPPVDWRPLPTLSARQPLATTQHFRVHVDPEGDTRLEAIALRWARRLEAILAADESRFDRHLTQTIDVVFSAAYEARCPARGLASPGHDPPLIVVYVPEDVTDRFMHGVLAHEMGHHLTASDDFVADGVLSEGLANWIAGPPMLAWMGLDAWDDAVRAAVASGAYQSLTQPDVLSPGPGENCIQRRDLVYALRASFVAWMIGEYGLDAVKAMPYSESRTTDADGQEVTTRQPDYAAATGLTLRQLERLWLEDVLVAGHMKTLLVQLESMAWGVSRA